MTTERIDIVIDVQGARTVKVDIDAIAAGAKSADTALTQLSSHITAMGRIQGQALEMDKRLRNEHYSQILRAHGTALEMEKATKKSALAEMNS
jgi:hypothetical protein